MHPSLSICIPTYNRKRYLRDLLDSIFCQVESKALTVCISDNASDDGTEQLIREYKNKYSNISYSRSENNKGPDRNFIRAANLANSDYIWLMGSDDLLEPGSLKKVFDRLGSEADIYLQDRTNFSLGGKLTDRQSWWSLDTKEIWDFAIDSPDQYYSHCVSLGGVFSYLSSIIVRRERWCQFQVPEHYFGSAYSHVFPLLKILHNGGRLELIQKSGVLNRLGNDFFAQNGPCERAAVDFRGFEKLSEEFESLNLFQILAKEYSGRKITSLSYLVYGKCVESEVVYAWLRKLGFTRFSYFSLGIRYYLLAIKSSLKSMVGSVLLRRNGRYGGR